VAKDRKIDDVRHTLDHLFRRESGRVVGALVRRFGTQHIDLCEDIVQDILLRALAEWPTRGMPERPIAWMMAAARNLAIDKLRRGSFLLQHESEIAEHFRALQSNDTFLPVSGLAIEDDLLRMIFACAHPSLARESQIVLVLRLLFGFSPSAIAEAMSVEPAAAQKRLVRAKEKFKSGDISLELPSAAALTERLSSVLNALYLTFALGYNSTNAASEVRREVCEDVLYLIRTLHDDSRFRDTRISALLSLALFQFGRLTTNVELFEEADQLLLESAGGETLSTYHLEAALAAQFVRGEENIDWPEVVKLYEVFVLLSDNGSARIALDHARERASAR
jgi:RNA polymerase sigma factor (sigma-70 family)